MAFTDDLNEKISNVGREMSQMVKDMSGKAKDLSDIAKLKMEVRNKEAMLREQYMKLGKKYYNEYHYQENMDAQDTIDLISDLLTEIDQINVQILEIKKSKTCPNCGAIIDEDAEYCSSCGAKTVIITED